MSRCESRYLQVEGKVVDRIVYDGRYTSQVDVLDFYTNRRYLLPERQSLSPPSTKGSSEAVVKTTSSAELKGSAESGLRSLRSARALCLTFEFKGLEGWSLGRLENGLLRNFPTNSYKMFQRC